MMLKSALSGDSYAHDIYLSYFTGESYKDIRILGIEERGYWFAEALLLLRA